MNNNANIASDFLDTLNASGSKALTVLEGFVQIGFDSTERVAGNQFQYGNEIVSLGLDQFSHVADKGVSFDILQRQKEMGEAFCKKAETYFQNLGDITKETQQASAELVINTAAEAGEAFSSKAA